MPASSRRSAARYVLDQAGGNVALDLFVLDQHLGSFLARAFEGSGVTPSQYAVYAQLLVGSRTPGELCETLGLRPPTLSGYLTAMDARGHLTRSRSEHDRRSTTLSLTSSGREQARQAQARMRRAVTVLHDQIGGPSTLESVRATLGRLDAAVTSAEAELGSSRA